MRDLSPIKYTKRRIKVGIKVGKCDYLGENVFQSVIIVV
jgi:hypothetical protein